jgi:hypothetical protein
VWDSRAAAPPVWFRPLPPGGFDDRLDRFCPGPGSPPGKGFGGDFFFWAIILLAAEFFDRGVFKKELIEQVQQAVDPKKLIFEIPTRHARGVTNHDRYSLETWLVRNLGKEVNIGNGAAEEVLQLEGLRRNLDSNMELREVPKGP